MLVFFLLFFSFVVVVGLVFCVVLVLSFFFLLLLLFFNPSNVLIFWLFLIGQFTGRKGFMVSSNQGTCNLSIQSPRGNLEQS